LKALVFSELRGGFSLQIVAHGLSCTTSHRTTSHTVSAAQRRTRSQSHNVASSIVVRLKLTLFKPWKLWRQC